MKLLRCHIANYGCLHDFSYEFQPGINLINQPNGWGKSTFASFLCAMLYGLDATTKRNIQENERKHYHPWQEGPFGGSLEFEISGREYRIERFFGFKEREDTFVLYDLKTMQPSQDYSSRLGIELFGIDKAGYLRSTYIPQGKTALEYNDTLAARLTRLNQSADDINQYEQAITEIDKALRFYVKTGKRGEIAILQQEADTTEKLLQDSQSAHRQLEELTSEQIDLEQQKLQLDRQLSAIQQQISIRTEQEIQARYNLLQSQLKQKEQSLDEMEEFFHDQLPDDSDIELYLLSCAKLSRFEQQKSQEALNDFQMQEYTFLRSFFTPGIMDDMENQPNTIAGSADEDLIFTNGQRKLLMQSELYQTEAAILFPSDDSADSDFLPLPEELPDQQTIQRARQLYYQYCTHLADQKQTSILADAVAKQFHTLEDSLEQEKQTFSEHSRAANQESQQQNQQHKNQCFSLFSMFSVPQICVLVFLLVAGLFISFLWTPIIGLPIGLLSVLLMLYNYVIFQRENNSDSGSDTKLQIHTEICTHLQEQISQLQTQYDSYQEQFAASHGAVEDCLEQLHAVTVQLNLPWKDFSLYTDNYLTLLAQLDNQLKTYQKIQQERYSLYKKQMAFYDQLKHKYKNYNLRLEKQRYQEQQIADLRLDIIQFLRPYFSITESETPSHLEIKLHELKSKLAAYRSLLSDRRLILQNLNDFLQEHPDFKQSIDQKNGQQLSNTWKSEIQICKSDLSPEDASAKTLVILQSEESEIRRQYASCIQQISVIQSHIRQLQDKAEEHCFLEEKKDKLKRQIMEYKERYRILSLTKQYLTKARHDFTENYLHSIEKNFSHYAQLFQRKELLNADMNSDFHVLVSDNGILRETDWYSQGTRDLIDLCSRLAIIEDLFSDETPFLVLDDPFVNLDDSSLERLSSILRDISDRWQILYFTCHSSRNIDTVIR